MADIAHVVVLMLENRSYDHLLGYVPHPDPAFDGLLSRAFTNPGWGRGPAVAASPDAKPVLLVGRVSHPGVADELVGSGPLVVLVDGEEPAARRDAGVGEQPAGAAGVLRGDQVGVAEGLDGSRREVAEVPDGGADEHQPSFGHGPVLANPVRR